MEQIEAVVKGTNLTAREDLSSLFFVLKKCISIYAALLLIFLQE